MASTIEVKLSPPETPHRRLNIETLQNQYPLQFSLFIRVLDVLKKSSEDPGNPYGWFQQCGMHIWQLPVDSGAPMLIMCMQRHSRTSECAVEQR